MSDDAGQDRQLAHERASAPLGAADPSAAPGEAGVEPEQADRATVGTGRPEAGVRVAARPGLPGADLPAVPLPAPPAAAARPAAAVPAVQARHPAAPRRPARPPAQAVRGDGAAAARHRPGP